MFLSFDEIVEAWEKGRFYGRPEVLLEAFKQCMTIYRHDIPQELDESMESFLEEGRRLYLLECRMTGECVPADSLLAWDMMGMGVMTRASSRRARVMPRPPPLPLHTSSEVISAGTGSGAEDAPDASSIHAPLPLQSQQEDTHSANQDESPGHQPQDGPPPWRPWESSSSAISPSPPNDSPLSSPVPESRREKRRASTDAAECEEEVSEPSIEMLQSRERFVKTFKSTFREEVMCVRGLRSFLDPDQGVMSLFDTIVKRQIDAVQAKDHDRCYMEVRGSNRDSKPINFHLRRVDQLSGRVIADKLAQTIQSNESFMSDGILQVSYIHIPTPEPGGYSARLPNESMDNWVARRIQNKSIFDPSNQMDKMCLMRSVSFAIAYMSYPKHKVKKMWEKNSRVLHIDAHNLRRECGFEAQKECDIDDLKTVQNVLKHYRLVVFTDQKGKEIVFKGPPSTLGHPRKNIYLLWYNRHFYAIVNVQSAFSKSYFCDRCIVGYAHRNRHKCGKPCWRCLSTDSHPASNEIPLTRCQECGRYFAGRECFEKHKNTEVDGLTTCQLKKFCPLCERTYNTMEGGKAVSHKCREIKCHYCKLKVPENHRCYMTPWEPKKLNKKTRYMTVYFDIETTQCDPVVGKPDSWRSHRPNLVISQQVCQSCENVAERHYTCDNCGERQHVFHSLDDQNIDVVGQFIDHLHSLSNEKKTEILILGHNFKSFDGYFVIEALLSRKMTPDVIVQGAKIISLKVGNWHFKDSLMFIPQKLSSLPKSFGLTELCKGYFPYLANKPEFYNYEGPLLSKDYYSTSTMKIKDKNQFDKWYEDRKREGYVFKFREELIRYCESDVTILREALQVFKRMFTEIGGFDPLFNCLTLSSACMCLYRKKHMPAYSIGVVPQGGYRGRDKQSYIALKWLDYEQHSLGNTAKIITAETGREVRVMKRPVDGYAEIKKDDGTVEKRIYAFHGCFWHAHPSCYPNPNRKVHGSDRVASNRYERTVRMTEMFRRNGFTVKEMWECEFNEELKNNEEMKSYYDRHPTRRTSPLNLRDALYGGRTSALRTYVKPDLTKGEEIKFVDVTSQYPNANLRYAYPVGHPEIYLENDPKMPDIAQMNGVVKAKVLAPRDLFLPILPYRCCCKLMFPLCRTCAESQNQGSCTHDDPEERALTGVWCAPEFQLAVEKGYKVMNIYEVYQYSRMAQFNPETGQDGLFSAYVRQMMALKIHASGWPAGVKTQEQKDQYIKDVLEKDGIILDPNKMIRNEGMRTLAKLILNSFCK